MTQRANPAHCQVEAVIAPGSIRPDGRAFKNRKGLKTSGEYEFETEEIGMENRGEEEEQDGLSVHSAGQAPPSSASSLPKVSFSLSLDLDLPILLLFFFALVSVI